MTTDKGLQVWLPLNGTLENKGLVKSTITSNGVRWSNSGKIGKCFDNSDRENRWILLQNAFPAHDTDHTVCFWVKSLPNIAASNDWGYIYTTSNVNATDAARCGIATDTTNGFSITDSCPVFTVTVNDRTQWNHITIVTTKTKVVVYVNGQYSNEQTRNTEIASSATRHIAISRNSTGSGTIWNMRGSINDFRVYSYALSPQEIKELSRCKVGHWLGDGNGTFFPNVSGTPKAIYQNCTKLSNNNWDISQNGSSKMVRFSNLGMNDVAGPWVVSFTAWASTEYISAIDLCDVGTKHIKIKTIPSKFFITATARDYYQTNSYNGFLDIVMPISISKLYIRDLKMEKGTIPSLYSTSNQAFLSDISGFGRHGNITGGITLSSDTKRYDKSLNFSTSDGRAYASIVQPIPNSPSAMTIAFWIKPDSASANSYRQCFSFNSGYHWLSINTENNKVWFYQGGTLYVRSSNGTLDSNWHHIAMVWNGSQYQFYIDGIADTTTYTSAPNYTLNIVAPQISTFIIGNNYTGTSHNGRLFKDYLSDIRLYATALSADDVKELYSLGH